MSVTVINNTNFEEEVLNSTKPVLIDFWAPWCGPCRMLSPIVDEIAEEYSDKYKICKVNVDDEFELSNKFGVYSIPTLVVIKDKAITNKSVGLKSKNAILAMLEE